MFKQIRYLILLGLLGVISASAQTTTRVKVLVPFPFNAASRTWAPGSYQLDINARNGLVIIHSSHNSRLILTRTTQTAESEVSDGGNYLQFVKYGNRWILSDIVSNGIENVVPPGRLVREYMAHNRPANRNAQIAFLAK